MNNPYVPFSSKIVKVTRHTEIEYTFRMEYTGDVKPGQFFEVSLPKYGEAPISVSGIGAGTIDLTIRKVGAVTGEIFENYEGDSLFMRGPYGNGFDLENYKGKNLLIIAGGTGLSPVRGVFDYFHHNRNEIGQAVLIAGFKNPQSALFRDDVANWEENMEVILTVDGAPEGYEGNVGMVTAYIPGLELKDMANTECIVVGPPIMMKFTVQELLKKGIKEEQIWISQERKMCCGLGKCGHCRMGDTYICLDGPVFPYTEGKALID